MVKNDISEINDIKTNTITLIVFNIILYTLIAIVLFLFGIVYVSAETINTDDFKIEGLNYEMNLSTCQTNKGYILNCDSITPNNATFGFQAYPQKYGVFAPLSKGEYDIHIEFTIDYPTQNGYYQLPFSMYLNLGTIQATCDGQEDYQVVATSMASNHWSARWRYTCSRINITRDFSNFSFRVFKYPPPIATRSNRIEIQQFEINDHSQISGDTNAIIENNNNNTQSIITNNNTNTDRIIEKQTEIYNQVHGLDSLFKDDNISNHTGVFGNITFNSTGAVSGIVSAPLSAIQGIISSTCSPLVLPLPYVNKNLTLPCMSTIYTQYFGNFFTMYQAIVLGIIAYWVCINIFRIVKKLGDPEDDRIEVLDL